MLFKSFLFLLLVQQGLVAQELFQEPWGKDTALLTHIRTVPPSQEPNLAVRVANAIILFHQRVISPVDGPRSDFRPTSSRYMQLAMHRYGFVKGYIMGCDRLLRENDEKWVYKTVDIDGKTFKYDPAWADKYHGLR